MTGISAGFAFGFRASKIGSRPISACALVLLLVRVVLLADCADCGTVGMFSEPKNFGGPVS